MRPCLAAVLALSPAILAQTVWNVAPPANLTQVFANAAPGDIVVLAPGTYARFVLAKGLTVIGPATIHGLDSPPTMTGPWNSVVQVPAGQRARLVGLDFEQGITTGNPTYPNTPHGLDISGDASIEDCLIGPGDPTVAISSGRVSLQRCTMRVGWNYGGSAIYGGLVSLTDCTLLPKDCFDFAYGQIVGTPALAIYGGAVTASGLTARGGTGCWCAFCPVPAASNPAIHAAWGTDVRITDSNLQAGVGPLAQSAVSGIASTRLARNTLVPILGGTPTTGGVLADGNLVGLRMTAGFVRGQTATVVATSGTSLGPLLIGASFDAIGVVAPGIEGIYWLQSATFVPLQLAFPAAGATVSTNIAVPSSPGLLGACAWVQAAQLAPSGAWYASPLVGGVVR
ncbi:MAG: hypothetical protein JNK15_14160 [Planctomycetes bacterium]|nr:hypothetical protein [Planctomycetota bacterium]